MPGKPKITVDTATGKRVINREMNYDDLHEIETVTFRLPEPKRLDELPTLLIPHGFKPHDDVFTLDRADTVFPWQHSSTVEVEVSCQGKEVFGVSCNFQKRNFVSEQKRKGSEDRVMEQDDG